MKRHTKMCLAVLMIFAMAAGILPENISFLSDAKVPTGVGFGACKISQTLVFDEYLAPFGAYKSFAACAIGCIVVTSQAKSFSSL